jgi:hypothetical protein
MLTNKKTQGVHAHSNPWWKERSNEGEKMACPVVLEKEKSQKLILLPLHHRHELIANKKFGAKHPH